MTQVDLQTTHHGRPLFVSEHSAHVNDTLHVSLNTPHVPMNALHEHVPKTVSHVQCSDITWKARKAPRNPVTPARTRFPSRPDKPAMPAGHNARLAPRPTPELGKNWHRQARLCLHRLPTKHMESRSCSHAEFVMRAITKAGSGWLRLVKAVILCNHAGLDGHHLSYAVMHNHVGLVSVLVFEQAAVQCRS